MTELPDGVYEVIVIDAETDAEGALRVDLVITSGEAKGSVTSLRVRRGASLHADSRVDSHALARDDDGLSLLGEPGRLTIIDGAPSFALG